ncbi:MAG: hypothetical protein AAF633_18405 [Chloroflexota bacterium]
MTSKTKHLFLIYGAGSGMGKTTLSRGLRNALTRKRMDVALVHEEEVLGITAFSPYVKQVRDGRGEDAQTLDACCANYVEQLRGEKQTVTVIDSILPCWDWLSHANCPLETVLDFTQGLVTHLKPLNPTLIILDGDIELAIKRAIEDRGQQWASELSLARVGEVNMPKFYNFFRSMRSDMEQYLSAWTHPIMRINVDEMDVEEAVKVIVETGPI